MAYQLQPGAQMVEGKMKADYYGKSTDTKPTRYETDKVVGGSESGLPLATGSICYELDTGEAFMYYADTPTGQDPWIMQ